MMYASIAMVLALVMALRSTGRRPRRLGLVLAAPLALLAPLAVPDELTLVRFVLSIASVILVMGLVDLVRHGAGLSWWGRIALLTTFVDLRVARPCRPGLDPHDRRIAAVHGGVAVLGWAMASASILLGPGAIVLRWLGGVVLVYGTAETVTRGVRLLYSALGRRVPLLHDQPIRAASVSAFWSRHYNRPVSGWLARNVQRPVARRIGGRAGLVAAFVVSTALHAWLAWVALDVTAAAMMGAFFLVQGGVVLLEGTWAGWRALSSRLRRVWTLGWLLVSAPLFVEPFLRLAVD